MLSLARAALKSIAESDRLGEASSTVLKNLNGEAVDQSLCEGCFFAARRRETCAAAHSNSSASDTFTCLLRRITSRLAATVAAWEATGFGKATVHFC